MSRIEKWCDSCRKEKLVSDFSSNSYIEYDVIETTIGECMIQGLRAHLCKQCLPQKEAYIQQKQKESQKCGRCHVCN